MLRRVRAIIGLGLIWALVWLPSGLLLGLVMRGISQSVPRSIPLWYVVIWTCLGASSGAVFAILLATMERNRTLGELSPQRLALWGAIAGAALPITVGVLVITLIPELRLVHEAPAVLAAMAVLGSVCAWATLRLAQRGALAEASAPRPPIVPAARGGA